MVREGASVKHVSAPAPPSDRSPKQRGRGLQLPATDHSPVPSSACSFCRADVVLEIVSSTRSTSASEKIAKLADNLSTLPRRREVPSTHTQAAQTGTGAELAEAQKAVLAAAEARAVLEAQAAAKEQALAEERARVAQAAQAAQEARTAGERGG